MNDAVFEPTKSCCVVCSFGICTEWFTLTLCFQYVPWHKIRSLSTNKNVPSWTFLCCIPVLIVYVALWRTSMTCLYDVRQKMVQQISVCLFNKSQSRSIWSCVYFTTVPIQSHSVDLNVTDKWALAAFYEIVMFFKALYVFVPK